MENEFVPYEQALALKELGFDENCFGFFWVTENHTSFLHIEFMIGKMNRLNKLNILRPTFSQAFRWLYQKLDIEKGLMPLDTKPQQLLLKELIEIVKRDGK